MVLSLRGEHSSTSVKNGCVGRKRRPSLVGRKPGLSPGPNVQNADTTRQSKGEQKATRHMYICIYRLKRGAVKKTSKAKRMILVILLGDHVGCVA